MSIHPTAVVHPGAVFGKDVVVGPYCVVGSTVIVGDGAQLLSHVVLEGRTTLGARSIVFPFASLGGAPQHVGYRGEDTALQIGEDTQIREHVTIHRGTTPGGGETCIGSHCLIMVGCHVAHDCCVGDHVIMANQVVLGGHVILEDHVFLSGLIGIHQFTRIGEGAMIGGFSAIGRDVIPYGIALGNRGGLVGMNLKKLQRLCTPREEIRALYALYRWLFHEAQETLSYRLQHIPSSIPMLPKVRKIMDFILANGTRPLCTPITGVPPEIEED